jgi:uncharacterized membrane protein
VQAFYNVESTDRQRLELISRYGINYVFWGPSERLLGDWNPRNSPYLNEVYESGEFTIFIVHSLGEN